MLNEDYKDMLLALFAENVRYLLVGATRKPLEEPRTWPMQKLWNY
jgi:hypothetical protein